MPTSTFNDTVIQGTSDAQQLQVRGVSGQTQPLQTWQDNVGNTNSRVTNQGYLQAGDVATQTALIEANETATLPTSKPLSGFHSLGNFTGPLGSALNWIVHELQLLGTGALNGLFIAHRTKLTYGNQDGTANASNATFRAGDFQAINQSTLSASPTKQLTGLRGTASNNTGAYLNQANAVEGAITNDTGGTLTQAAAFSIVPVNNAGTIGTLYGLQMPDLTQGIANYAIYSGQGVVHLGDLMEIPVFASAPATNPPTNFIKLYSKLNAGVPQLYAKNASGSEFNLSGISGIVPLSLGGTGADLQFSGGSNQFLKQISSGAAISVAGITSGDLTTPLATPPNIGLTTPAAAYFTFVSVRGTSTSIITMQANPGSLIYTLYSSTSRDLWALGTDGTAESGSNAGQDFILTRYNDSGSSLGVPFRVNRATGLVTLLSALKLSFLTTNNAFLYTDASGNVSQRTLLASDLPNHSTSLLTSGLLALARGGVNLDLTGTGGAGKYLQQQSAGGAITVAGIPSADIATALATPGNIGFTTAGRMSAIDLQLATAPSSGVSMLNISGTSTNAPAIAFDNAMMKTDNTSRAVIGGQVRVMPTATHTGWIYGMLFIPKAMKNTGDNTSYAISRLYALLARVDAEAAYTQTITEVRALTISDPSKGGATITTNYGLYIESQTAGATNYGAYINDNVQIIGAADRVQLNVKANTTQSTNANIVEFRDSSNNLIGGVHKDRGVFVRTGSGAPSGAATAGTLYVDTTNFKLYLYTGAAWKGSAAFT